MANPFKPDDKVRITVKGADVEATVRLVWNDEVQVRTPDKTLLWRAVKTVRPFETATPAPTEPMQTPPPPAEPMPNIPGQNDSTMTPTGDVQPAPMVPQNETVDAPIVSTEAAGGMQVAPVVPQNETVDAPIVLTDPAVEAERSDSLPHASAAPTPEVSSCGVPETVAERSRAKKKGRRR